MDITKYQTWVEANYYAQRSLAYTTIALAGEVGEYANLVKKYMRMHETDDTQREAYNKYTQGKDQIVTKERLMDELGDVLHYIMSNCIVLGISVDDIIKMIVDKINQRRAVGGLPVIELKK